MCTAACGDSDNDSAATEEDYDDVAQSLGVVVSTGNGGGEVVSLADSSDLAIGIAPLGITLKAAGEFNGSRAGVAYDYALTCSDERGQRLDACGAQTDTASVNVAWSGNLVLPNFSAAMERQGTWQLTGLQAGTAVFSGNSSFEADAQFQAAWRNIQRKYHLSYTAVYDDVTVQRLPRGIVSGSVHYDVTASRKASSDKGASEATFDVSADLTFSNGSADLTLDGSHHYTVNVVSGQVTRHK
ncbi:MAG TPA: hypothetical protein VK524_17405 [Polyangiaceae bacterium]|nr:hypothetical protein [Polyangiaceae bacterium]